MEKEFKKTKAFWDNNYFLILSLIPLVLIILFQPQQITFIPILFGNEQLALFDLWSIQHFLAGVLIGSLFLSSEKKPTKKWQRIIPFLLFIALAWEALEIALEHDIIFYYESFEHWTNRMITDPLMVLIGGAVGYIIKDSWRVAVVPAIMWLVIKALLL